MPRGNKTAPARGTRFVSWVAVSSEEQADKISLDDQAEGNRRHIERHGGTIVAELSVPGKSRDIVLFEDACRRIEAYAQLRDLIDAGAFDVLICLRRSRLGRTLAVIEAIAELCRRAGIIIYETESPPGDLTLRSDGGDLLLGAIKSAEAQREIIEMRRRHEMGMRGRFQRGDFLKGVPWGWREVFDPSGASTIEIDPEAAAVIRLVLVDLYVHRGMGMQAISKELNRRNITTPQAGKPYDRFLMRHFLRMVWRYAGYNEINVRSKKRPYARQRGAWPAILSEEELQAVLAERELRRKGRRSVNTKHRLSLICWCRTCNARMRITHNGHWYTRKRTGERVRVELQQLRCMSDNIYHTSIVQTKVMRELRAEFIRIQDRTTWHALLDAPAPSGEALGAAIADLRAVIERHKAAILKADDHYIDGALDAERHSHQVKRLQARIEVAAAEITRLEEQRAALAHAGQRGKRLEEAAAAGLAMLEHPDATVANAWLRRHVRVWIESNEVVEIEFL